MMPQLGTLLVLSAACCCWAANPGVREKEQGDRKDTLCSRTVASNATRMSSSPRS